MPEGLSQPDPVPADTLQSLAPSTGSLSQLESGGAAQHRSAGWGGPLTGVQSYSLHALEDLYHTQGYPTPAPYPFTSFMTMSNDPPPKVGPFSQDEGADTSALQDTSPWTKEDGSLAWGILLYIHLLFTASLVPFSNLKHTRLFAVLQPLHLLVSLPGMFFFLLLYSVAYSHPSGLA